MRIGRSRPASGSEVRARYWGMPSSPAPFICAGGRSIDTHEDCPQRREEPRGRGVVAVHQPSLCCREWRELARQSAECPWRQLGSLSGLLASASARSRPRRYSSCGTRRAAGTCGRSWEVRRRLPHRPRQPWGLSPRRIVGPAPGALPVWGDRGLAFPRGRQQGPRRSSRVKKPDVGKGDPGRMFLGVSPRAARARGRHLLCYAEIGIESKGVSLCTQNS